MRKITMSDETRIVINKGVLYQYYKRIAFSGPLPWILVREKGFSKLEYFATEEEVIKWIEKQ